MEIGMADDERRERLEQWIDRLDLLAASCAGRVGRDPGDILLDAERLLRACPPELADWCLPVASSETLALQRAVGAHVSIALGLCSGQVSYLVSRSAAGDAIATLALPGLECEASCIANDPAIAIAGALALLLARAFADRAMPSTGAAAPAGFSRLRPGSLS
jgi:hypothetical protein